MNRIQVLPPLPNKIFPNIIRSVCPWERRAMSLVNHAWNQHVTQITREDLAPEAARLKKEIKKLKTRCQFLNLTNPYLLHGVHVSLKEKYSIAQMCLLSTSRLEKLVLYKLFRASNDDLERLDSALPYHFCHKYPFAHLVKRVTNTILRSKIMVATSPSLLIKALMQQGLFHLCVRLLSESLFSEERPKCISAICHTKLNRYQVDDLLTFVRELRDPPLTKLKELTKPLLKQINHPKQIEFIFNILEQIPDDAKSHDTTCFKTVILHHLSQSPFLDGSHINPLLRLWNPFHLISTTLKNFPQSIWLERFAILQALCQSPHLTFDHMKYIFQQITVFGEWTTQLDYPTTLFLTVQNDSVYSSVLYLQHVQGGRLAITFLDYGEPVHAWIEGVGLYKCVVVGSRKNDYKKLLQIRILETRHFLRFHHFFYLKTIEALEKNPNLPREWVEECRNSLMEHQFQVDYLKEEQEFFLQERQLQIDYLKEKQEFFG